LAACGQGPSLSSSPSPLAPTPSPSPSTTPVEGALAVASWPDSINPDNIDEFKTRFGVQSFEYATFVDDDELMASLEGGSAGIDICTPTATSIVGMIAKGLLHKLDFGRIPNAQFINPAFLQQPWDPDQEYHVPKDYGTTGILYLARQLSAPPVSWQQFRDLVMGEASGKTIVVDSMTDVFAFPLKLLGHSLNSVDKAELKAARKILLEVAPHILALDSDNYGPRLDAGEAILVLGWPGPLLGELASPETSDTGYVVPSEGSLLLVDTWAMLADAPHPDGAYAWLNFIHEPAIQAEESSYTGYATPNDEAKPLVDPQLLANPAVFPPDDVLPRLEGALDTTTNTQRLDIWEEFKAKVAAG
jgi:spermidine/putrescine transport system substrate-binding protein